MHECDVCGFEAKSRQGLASHQSARHRTFTGSMVEAMERTIAALEEMGRVERVDAARIQSLRSIALALDLYPGNAQMWRELREQLGEVTAADDDADDGLARALAKIGGAAEVGDT